MNSIEAFQTSDGQVFLTHREAHRHADQRYGNALTSLAHKLLKVEKYSAMVPFLEENLALFAELQALKADCVLAPSTEDSSDDED